MNAKIYNQNTCSKNYNFALIVCSYWELKLRKIFDLKIEMSIYVRFTLDCLTKGIEQTSTKFCFIK